MTQAMTKIQTMELSLEETRIPGNDDITFHRMLTDEALADHNQQVVYDDSVHTFQNIALLREARPLTSPPEIQNLTGEMAEVAKGNAFIIQAGLCAETMDDKTTPAIMKQYAENMAMMVNELADALEHETGMPVVRVIRGAGQFAKPRSVAKENGDWTFRGEVTNSQMDRKPNPARLIKAYQFSKEMLHHMPQQDGKHIYASHEALSLAYETGLHQGEYAGSAPMLWIGNRTNEPDGMHVKFAASVSNVIAVKIDGNMSPEKLNALIETLNPDRIPGKLALIFRIGAKDIDTKLSPLLDIVAAHGSSVVAMCDPMHGNTETDPVTGKKTRHISNIRKEAVSFTTQCLAKGIHPGGFNLEVSPNEVTECMGLNVSDLTVRYESEVDPCMNTHQAVEGVIRPVGQVFYKSGHKSVTKPALALV